METAMSYNVVLRDSYGRNETIFMSDSKVRAMNYYNSLFFELFGNEIIMPSNVSSRALVVVCEEYDLTGELCLGVSNLIRSEDIVCAGWYSDELLESVCV